MSEEKKVVWDAEADNPELCDKLRAGLRAVTDPEIGMDVIQLGLIRNVTIEDDSAVVNAILTTPFCPYGPSMLEAIRERSEQVLQLPTRIEYGREMWEMSMMEGGEEGEGQEGKKSGFEWNWFF